jgi:hypothetical protein
MEAHPLVMIFIYRREGRTVSGFWSLESGLRSVMTSLFLIFWYLIFEF